MTSTFTQWAVRHLLHGAYKSECNLTCQIQYNYLFFLSHRCAILGGHGVQLETHCDASQASLKDAFKDEREYLGLMPTDLI